MSKKDKSLSQELAQLMDELVGDIEERTYGTVNPAAIAALLLPFFNEIQELRERLADGEEQT